LQRVLVTSIEALAQDAPSLQLILSEAQDTGEMAGQSGLRLIHPKAKVGYTDGHETIKVV
jgi:hypothetical protein